MPMLMSAAKSDMEERIRILKAHYPVRYKMKKGAAHWDAGNRARPSQYAINSYDMVIAGDKELTIYCNPRSPISSNKHHTYMENTLNFGIACAGMAGTNSNIWERYKWNTDKYKTMISKDQFEAMCFMFGFVVVHFHVPTKYILTHEEYARKSYPRYPNGYFPARWDFMGEGPAMRSKINYYRQKILEIYDEV